MRICSPQMDNSSCAHYQILFLSHTFAFWILLAGIYSKWDAECFCCSGYSALKITDCSTKSINCEHFVWKFYTCSKNAYIVSKLYLSFICKTKLCLIFFTTVPLLYKCQLVAVYETWLISAKRHCAIYRPSNYSWKAALIKNSFSTTYFAVLDLQHNHWSLCNCSL